MARTPGTVPFASTYTVLRAVVTGAVDGVGGTVGAYAALATGVTATSYTDATAAIGTVYDYEVQAVNRDVNLVIQSELVANEETHKVEVPSPSSS